MTGPDESDFAKYERMGLEADKLQAAHAGRRTNNSSRASVVVGAAGVGATVAASGGGLLHLGAVLAFLVAAGFGLASLRPRRGIGINLDPLFDDLFITDRTRIELTLLQVKLLALREDEQALLREARWVIIGFLLLGLAIALLAAHAVAGTIMVDRANLGGVL